jgi:hypothetical protein
MVVRRKALRGSPPVGRGATGGGRAIGRLVRGVVLGIALTGCSIPFGNGGEPAPSGQSPQETRRERNRLFQEEQERMQRQSQFDRVGPPSDR